MPTGNASKVGLTQSRLPALRGLERSSTGCLIVGACARTFYRVRKCIATFLLQELGLHRKGSYFVSHNAMRTRINYSLNTETRVLTILSSITDPTFSCISCSMDSPSIPPCSLQTIKLEKWLDRPPGFALELLVQHVEPHGQMVPEWPVPSTLKTEREKMTFNEEKHTSNLPQLAPQPQMC